MLKRPIPGHILCAITTFVPASLMAANGDADYVRITCNDGTIHSIAARGLSMTIQGADLQADNGTESVNLPLDILASFSFSAATGTTDETLSDQTDAPYSVYSLNGTLLYTIDNIEQAHSKLPDGTYVLTNRNRSLKITIGK